jgi:purine catabolism regulator
VLGPLDAADRAAELLRGLTAFLEHNGHWGSAASALRVHRHTLRHRIDAIERLTGQDRHELWLALGARDAAQMSAD